MRAAFIGLGDMGASMVARLVAQGVETSVYDLAPAAIDACVAKGAKAAASPAAAAAGCEAIGVCVPEDDHVRGVLRGPNGVLAGAQRGAVIAVHSTILPSTAQELAREAADAGLGLLDACVTGGAARAVQGKLVFLVGGEASHVERIKPYLEACSERVVHAGAIGSGAKLKLCINLITYLQWVASFEAMTLAKAAGLPQQVLEDAGRGNGQITELMIQYMALHKAPEAARKSEGMQKFLRAQLFNAEKDLAWTLKLARECGVALPGTALASQIMARIYTIEDPGKR
ncbi:MAG TPA: NAD(P)-dependent oxidoreductase [Myxococcota bacterium]|jgi:3-hydroxyisobutyrate dehydrogenase-like beta-hydroxyacid dehydrogenase